MPVSAGEVEKAESRDRSRLPRQYTEEYRLEAAGHCRKAREADPKKSIRECASEPGTSDKTLNDWTISYAYNASMNRRCAARPISSHLNTPASSRT